MGPILKNESVLPNRNGIATPKPLNAAPIDVAAILW